MTRAELIHQMALMTDEELEKCILIYKDGGKPNKEVDAITLESKPTPLKPKTFEEFFKMLPDDEALAFREGRYNWVRAFELAPWEEIVNHLVDPNAHHMRDFYWNLNGEGEFMKNKNYPHLYDYNEDPNKPLGEIGWYLHSPEAESFRNEYELDESGLYPKYKKRPTKHLEGGTLENVNLDQMVLELNKEEEPDYKLIKLCKEGSILDLLKQQLPDDEVIDLLKNFGIDELLEGGIKKGSTVSIRIILGESSNEEAKKAPETKNIEIGDKSYKVEVVSSEEDMEKGLGGYKSLDEDKGMLFDFGSVLEEVTFNCEEMAFPIDIVFINDDDEVIRVAENCQPGKDLFTESNVRYVLEVNTNSGISKNDELDLEPNNLEVPTMKVLAPDGSTLMELLGGERIFSRKNTKTLIKMAKKAEATKADSDYKRLGNKMFKYIHTLDTNKPEYVEVPED